MGNYKRSGRESFNRNSRPSRSFGARDSGRSSSDRLSRSDNALTEVTCDKCGKTCQVPFKPSGNKPVYCKDCSKRDDGPSDRSFSPKVKSISPEDLDQLNEKLDKIMRALDIE